MAANEYEAFLAKVAAQYGVARVALDRIWFDEMADDSRTLDPAHVSRLLQLFQQGQCDRLDPDHYLSAVISDQLLHRVLERAQLSIESLRLTEPPFLPLRGEEYLVGIDGLHRHQAAVQYFSNRPERDRWWIVKLYDDRGELDVSLSVCSLIIHLSTLHYLFALTDSTHQRFLPPHVRPYRSPAPMQSPFPPARYIVKCNEPVTTETGSGYTCGNLASGLL